MAWSMSVWGHSAKTTVAPIATKFCDPPGLGGELEVGEHEHAAEAVADPVDPVAGRCLLDVLEHGGDVVADDLVDVPAALADFQEEGLAELGVDPAERADLGAVAGAAEVEDEDLVAPRRSCSGRWSAGR